MARRLANILIFAFLVIPAFSFCLILSLATLVADKWGILLDAMHFLKMLVTRKDFKLLSQYVGLLKEMGFSGFALKPTAKRVYIYHEGREIGFLARRSRMLCFTDLRESAYVGEISPSNIRLKDLFLLGCVGTLIKSRLDPNAFFLFTFYHENGRWLLRIFKMLGDTVEYFVTIYAQDLTKIEVAVPSRNAIVTLPITEAIDEKLIGLLKL